MFRVLSRPMPPLDVATGEVQTRCRPRHRHQEFAGFLRQIRKSVPEDLDVHLIVDNTQPIAIHDAVLAELSVVSGT